MSGGGYNWKFAYVSLILIAIFIVMLIPIPSQVVPEWKFTVQDIHGKKCSGMSVEQSWGNYSYFSDGAGDSERRTTDVNGLVVFPVRYIYANLFRRIFKPPIQMVLTLAHGSYGPDAYLIVSGQINDEAWNKYEPGDPVPKYLEVRECLANE